MRVSLYIDDDELWWKFKKNVLRKTGDLRSPSSEVQSLMQESSDEDFLRKGFGKLGVDVKPINSSQVVQVRPSVRTSSTVMVMEMRVRRYFRSRKNLPR